MSRETLRGLLWIGMMAVGVAACAGPDSEASPTDGGAGPSAGTGGAGAGAGGGAGGSAGSSGQAPVCPGPGYAVEASPRTIKSLDAKILSPEGAPLDKFPVQLCGIDLCANGKTNASGQVTYCSTPGVCPIGFKNLTEVRPAFKHGSGLTHARFAYSLPEGQDTFDLGEVVAVPIPPPGTGTVLEAGTTATSGQISLSVPQDALVEIDELSFETPEDRQFRARVVPTDELPAAVDPALGLELVVALAPTEAHLCPAATLSVPNVSGFEAGAVLEVFLHGVSVEEHWAPYAGWAKITEARVSADGETLTTDGGIHELSVVGFRRKAP